MLDSETKPFSLRLALLFALMLVAGMAMASAGEAGLSVEPEKSTYELGPHASYYADLQGNL
ncbi:MAG: hypothetical protein R3208_01340, partial [Ketobacteraceae bacterium]|nr:hypothetical protein [Ketobacteraceae bacterium]